MTDHAPEKPRDYYTLRDLIHEVGATTPSKSAAIADALFTAGVRPPVAAAPRTAIGQPADATTRQGMIARAVHPINADTIAEHGVEVSIMAYLQQSIRELAQLGADPAKDSSFMVVGMEDGTVIVTAEARVGS